MTSDVLTCNSGETCSIGTELNMHICITASAKALSKKMVEEFCAGRVLVYGLVKFICALA